MKIFIADKLSPKTVAALEQLDADVTVNAEVKDEELGRVLYGTEVLIVRSKKVSAAAIAAAPQLSLIIRAGAGVNTIDLGEASRRGIFVANCPGKNTDAVAELTIGLLVAADRRLAAELESRMVAAADGSVGLAPAVESRVGIAWWAPPA